MSPNSVDCEEELDPQADCDFAGGELGVYEQQLGHNISFVDNREALYRQASAKQQSAR